MSGVYREIFDDTTNVQEVELVDGAGVKLGTSSNPMRVDPTGTTTQPVSATSLPLPTGASTSALQTTGNTSLSSIDTKTPALGQALMAASTPVVIASNQSAIPVTQSGSWTVTANAGTNLNTSALALDTSVNGILVSQGSTTSGEKGPLIQGAVTTASPFYTTAQTSPLSLTLSGALRTDASATTQPISGTVTANQGGTWNITNISGTVSLPTGAATSANQTTEITALQLIDNPIGSTIGGTAGTSSSLAGLIFNTSLPTLTTGQQAALQGDSSARLIIAPLTNTSVVKAQLQDNAGTAVTLVNAQLQVRDVINTAGQYRAQSVTTSAAEALGGATILANRKMVVITPTNGTIYWGFSNTVTTSTGTPIFKNQTVSLAVTDNVHVFVIASGTTDCRMAEAS